MGEPLIDHQQVENETVSGRWAATSSRDPRGTVDGETERSDVQVRVRRPEVSYRVPTRRVSGEKPRAQHGFALIEVLVSLALVGSVVLALVGALLMLVNTSNSTSDRQQIQLALAAMTENLIVAPYLPCPGGADVDAYNAAYANWPSRWTPSRPGMQSKIVAVEYWDEDPSPVDGVDPGPSFQSTCPENDVGAPEPDQGAQRLTVEVEWRGRSETAQVVTTATP